MSVSGSLASVPIPDVLQWLARAHKTGALTLSESTGVSRLIFEDGRIVGTDQDIRALAHEIAAHGLVDDTKLNEVIAEHARSPMSEDELLDRLGITRDDMDLALASTSERAVMRLLSTTDGSFLFEPSPVPSSSSTHSPLDVPELLMTGVTRLDEEAHDREIALTQEMEAVSPPDQGGGSPEHPAAPDKATGNGNNAPIPAAAEPKEPAVDSMTIAPARKPEPADEATVLPMPSAPFRKPPAEPNEPVAEEPEDEARAPRRSGRWIALAAAAVIAVALLGFSPWIRPLLFTTAEGSDVAQVADLTPPPQPALRIETSDPTQAAAELTTVESGTAQPIASEDETPAPREETAAVSDPDESETSLAEAEPAVDLQQIEDLVAEKTARLEQSLRSEYSGEIESLRAELDSTRAQLEAQPAEAPVARAGTDAASEPTTSDEAVGLPTTPTRSAAETQIAASEPAAVPARLPDASSEELAAPALDTPLAGEASRTTPVETPPAPQQSPAPEPSATQPPATPLTAAPLEEASPEPVAPTVQPGELVEGRAGVIPPELLSHPAPHYPDPMRRLGKTATVILRLLIDENGRVTEIEPAGPKQGFGFDAQAQMAARKSRWKGATKNGVPVKMWSEMKIIFRP